MCNLIIKEDSIAMYRLKGLKPINKSLNMYNIDLPLMLSPKFTPFEVYNFSYTVEF
jgi:hypothetical protein